MKHSRKSKFFLILALVFVALVGTFSAVNAAGNLQIKLNGAGDGHIYQAYQVFSGTVDSTGTILTNIDWGDGVVGADLLIELKADATVINERDASGPTGSQKPLSEIFENCTSASDVASVLELYENDSDVLQAFANDVAKHLSGTSTASEYTDSTYTIDVPETGYYFIKDSQDPGIGEFWTRYVLTLIHDQEIDVKGSVPTVNKKVSIGEGELLNALSAEIGEEVNFTITGTIPTTWGDYSKYYYAFHDTLSSGFTYVEESLHVYLQGAPNVDITEHFTVTVSPDGTIDVVCDDLKSAGITPEITQDSKIIVEYQAVLDSDAVIGEEGNPNTVNLEFTNDPNEETSTTKTPDDTVKVFTYELDVDKENGKTNDKLAGAGFKLYKKEGDKVLWAVTDENGVITSWTEEEVNGSELKTDATGKAGFKGVSSGEYYLKETTVPDGYNALPGDVKVVITDTFDGNEEASAVEPALKTLTVSVNDGEPAPGSVAEGTVAAKVLNNPGTLIPGTGGIGTVIFYVVGGLLVVGAVVLLLRSRKLNKQ